MQNFIVFLTHHWLLAIIFLILVVALIWVETQGKVGGMHRITPQATINLINREDAVTFDLRDRELYAKGHIAKAIQVDYDHLADKDMSKYVDTPLIFVASGTTNATKLGLLLKKLGLTKVYFLQGGMTAWQNANLPTVKK